MRRVRKALPLLGCVLLGCALLAWFAPGAWLRRDEPPPTPPRRTAYEPAAFIDQAQDHLRRHPGDTRTWADLGGAYLEQARRTGDPAFYGKAQGALQRSLPHIDAVIGMGALANARHDFALALRWGTRARRAAPYRWPLYAVLTDAYVELGQYVKADRVLRHLLDGRPDLVSFTRAAHLFQLRGQSARAREALERAREIASDPADYAFCVWQLGELAWSDGDPRAALAHTPPLSQALSPARPAPRPRSGASPTRGATTPPPSRGVPPSSWSTASCSSTSGTGPGLGGCTRCFARRSRCRRRTA
jgi:tetratricopeptide (TPR) repeat protein